MVCERDSERVGEPVALLLVRSPVAKPGSVNARMSLRGLLFPVHRLGRDDQRVRRVQPARDARCTTFG